MVGHLFAVQQTGDFRREVCALHKGQLSGKQGGDLRRRTAHVVGKIAAVRSRISKQLLFVQGLRQIKGLFCGISVNAVCFPLQAGKVKEFRRGNGFLLAGNGSTNRLCRFASGFQIPGFVCGVDLRACGFHAAEGQAHMVVFFFLKGGNGGVPVYKHFERRGLDAPHIQRLSIQAGKQAGHIDTDNPIGFCPAKGRGIKGVVLFPVFEGRKARLDCAFFHRGNPKAAHGLFAARHIIDKTENEFSLAPCVASVDDFGNVGAVHEVF